jgi:hypothetical protein
MMCARASSGARSMRSKSHVAWVVGKRSDIGVLNPR